MLTKCGGKKTKLRVSQKSKSSNEEIARLTEAWQAAKKYGPQKNLSLRYKLNQSEKYWACSKLSECVKSWDWTQKKLALSNEC